MCFPQVLDRIALWRFDYKGFDTHFPLWILDSLNCLPVRLEDPDTRHGRSRMIVSLWVNIVSCFEVFFVFVQEDILMSFDVI